MTASTQHDKEGLRAVWLAVLVAFLIAYFYWFKSPVTFAFDPNDEKCLPDVHLSLLVKNQAPHLDRGDLAFWRPSGALSYVKQEYVLKRVSGVAGDRLEVRNGVIKINGEVVVSGMPLLDESKVKPAAFDRDLIIPAGAIFVTGTHPLSNDSRYWGFLNTRDVIGKGYKLL